ncbi:hypothetical protein GUITHDRAFT_104953 [Guillardia theta CCMP2712]|uniref:RWP-RK domain-containing protein n=1 Tax=Guillardia theta (strain CCMP2712) TaxID=905079 RepID=L1JME7_GUITC|nr:hypothetical protein GUITHDRAFT_104953 [Guillardia theta CCMP2712]EKX49424.1 hypothetical protein GUITHDRAFT_104953 [Guillardia theta CCMP2712]|eukprot:XP_005836404.1 hypothetical protein GUITHDRAFT_104953 [Guillardia theta CCMP2712]
MLHHNADTADKSLVRKPRAIRKNCIRLELSRLQALFCYKESEAAKILGISLTAMKRVCRRAGVMKWPYSRTRVSPSGPPSPSSLPPAYSAILTKAVEDEPEGDCESLCGTQGAYEGVPEDECWMWEEDQIPLEVEWIEWYMSSEDD